MFSETISIENERLKRIAAKIPVKLKEQLDDMITQHTGIGSLNLIKTDQKDFKFIDIRGEVKKANQIKELYGFCKKFIPRLELSRNCIGYYCELIDQFDTFRVSVN